MRLQNIDLDVSHPDQVAGVLRAAAQTFYEDGAELTSAWQSSGAGEPWYKVAGILEDAADRIERALTK